jgi:hypothetical protein
MGYWLHSPYHKDGMCAWRISFVLEYDLEPVLKSRALGLWWLLLHILLIFNTPHNTTPLCLSGLENLERCCASTT